MTNTEGSDTKDKVLAAAIESGRNAQLMVNLLLRYGAKLPHHAMPEYNRLSFECQKNAKIVNNWTDGK